MLQHKGRPLLCSARKDKLKDARLYKRICAFLHLHCNTKAALMHITLKARRCLQQRAVTSVPLRLANGARCRPLKLLSATSIFAGHSKQYARPHLDAYWDQSYTHSLAAPAVK